MRSYLHQTQHAFGHNLLHDAGPGEGLLGNGGAGTSFPLNEASSGGCRTCPVPATAYSVGVLQVSVVPPI